jgi:hypothetical protein
MLFLRGVLKTPFETDVVFTWSFIRVLVNKKCGEKTPHIFTYVVW